MRDKLPPAPTKAVADTTAAAPVCPSSWTLTPIDTNPLYPDPKVPPVNAVVNPVMEPPAPTTALTAAPTKGAYPNPPEEPRETITPPLGSWFWLMSISDIWRDPSAEVIPLKMTLVIPAVLSSSNLKLLNGLLEVEGVWKIPLINRTPFPPVLPIPVVFAPPTVSVNVAPIPVNWSEISSYIWLVS